MDTTNAIYLAALDILGRESGDSVPGLLSACSAAEAELGAALRDGVSSADCGEAWTLACAMLGAAVLRDMEGTAELQTGGLRLRARDTAPLRLAAETLLAPYSRDGGFAFRGVPG